jgi:aminoglycoside phosphotransferase (APT) family kinase protein
MPAPVGRDLEKTRGQLRDWFCELLVDARGVEVGALSGPGATGFSSDTLIFDVSYTQDGEDIEVGLVVRIQPRGFQLFPEYDLPAQYTIMKVLGERTDIPVPKMLWEERSGNVIGDAFYVMEKIDGVAPADNPTYTAEGWLKDMSPDDQTTLWRNYLDVLDSVQALDPYDLGLDFLAKPELGATAIDQELAYYRNFYRWTYGDERHPVVEPSLAWLEANKPPMPEAYGLVWGDARIGNMIFQGTKVAAVIDWEMARLGDPIMDLAWGLFLGRYHADGNGVPPLPGFPTREETIALYEGLTGRSTENLAYYEILAGMRFSVILIRLAQQLKHYEFLPQDSDFEINNPVANLHRKELEAIGVL